MSESSFSWADDAIDEAERQENTTSTPNQDNALSDYMDDQKISPPPSPTFSTDDFYISRNTTPSTSPTNDIDEWEETNTFPDVASGFRSFKCDENIGSLNHDEEYSKYNPHEYEEVAYRSDNCEESITSSDNYEDSEYSSNENNDSRYTPNSLVDEHYGHDSPSHDENDYPRSLSAESEPEYKEPLSIARAIAENRFNDWVEIALWGLNNGKFTYPDLFLPHLPSFSRGQNWREEEPNSMPKPKYASGNAADPSKLVDILPDCERSYYGRLTYESLGVRFDRQYERFMEGIEEREVEKTLGEMQALKYSEINRWIARPSKLRNSWTML